MTRERKDLVKVGITMGDYNGVGPEIILKTFKDLRMFDEMIPVVYGHSDVFKHYRNTLDLKDYPIKAIASVEDIQGKNLHVINASDSGKVSAGKASTESGTAAFKALKKATEDLASNKIDVLVTAPINKDTIQSEEFNFPGHTEYLASMSSVEECLMILMTDYLKVGVVTGHIPLKEVAETITKEAIKSRARMLIESLKKDFGFERPKLAVLGLNPHAGDNGLLGKEEKEIIIPAVRELKEEGHLVYGAYPADGFFGSDQFKSFDGVLAMYHDQGLIPFKALAFNEGVNFTAGLPVIRTSPDHGTAYGIAGTGKADETSFRTAIFQARDIFNRREFLKEMTANPLKSQNK